MQIFIPTTDHQRQQYDRQQFTSLKQELTDKFTGVTIYARAPAHGLWKPGPGVVQTDNVVIYEVLTPYIDLSYWNELKSRLENVLGQQQILMRYFSVSIV